MDFFLNIEEIILYNSIQYFSFGFNDILEGLKSHKYQEYNYKLIEINSKEIPNMEIKLWEGLGKFEFSKGAFHGRFEDINTKLILHVNDILKIKYRPYKKALFFSLNNFYYIGFETYFKSLLKHHPDFNLDILILNISISEKVKEKLRKLYSRVIFKDVNYQAYENKFIMSNEYTKRLLKKDFKLNFYKLDVFSYDKYDTIICSDADMIIMDDISSILKFRTDIYSCTRYNDNKPIQGGLLIIGKRYLNQRTYQKLISTQEFHGPMAEQDLLSKLLKFKILDKAYNIEKRLLYKDCDYSLVDKELEISFFNKKYKNKINSKKNIKIIHFVGPKPWMVNNENFKFLEINKFWYEFNRLNRIKKKLLIIGNSPSLLEQKKKNEIDNFDLVFRINNFQIKDFEDYVGTKISKLFITSVTKFSEELINIDDSKCLIFLRHESNQDKAKINCKQLNFDFSKIDKNFYILNDLSEMYFKTKKIWFTTGLATIFYAIKTYFLNYDIFIHGFSLSKINIEGYRHYFDNNKGTFAFHSQSEHLIIKKLIDMNYISVL